jgi:putative intracellular protease/amidase
MTLARRAVLLLAADGNLISARTPADLGPWMKALLAALESAG